MRQIRRISKHSAGRFVVLAMCFALMLVPDGLAATTGLNAVATQQTPKASDQGNDEAAIKLAAQIRRALVNDKSLSVRAHNITIVVRNGTVTLRGMVASGQEKQAVHQKVLRIAGSEPVNDLLTVKQ